MNLTKYYEEFQIVYILGNIVIILMFIATVFLFVRRKVDTKSIGERVVLYIIYALLFIIVSSYYFRGPYLCKKDIDLGTIYGYEGNFEIVETTNGIYNKAVFIIDGQKICLKYFKDDGYDFDALQPGEYDGRIIYAYNASKVLDIEIYSSN